MDIDKQGIRIDLSQPPEIVQSGLSLHGYRETESFRMRENVFGLHAYMYSGSLMFGGRLYQFNDHSISLTPPETEVEWHFPDHAPHFYIHFFAPNSMNSVSTHQLHKRFPVITESRDLHRSFCTEIEQIAGRYRTEPHECRIRLWAMLIKLAQFDGEDRQNETASHPSVQIARSIIDNAASGGITVSELAGRVGTSPDYLSLLFKREEGMPLKKYLMRRKCEKAYYLLTHSSLSVKSVAKEVGIDDLQQFNKMIRRYFGSSPREIGKRGPG